MKRLHINLGVRDLDASVRFYTTLFDAPPTVLKDDYARWMLDDPRVNFSVNTRTVGKGIDHLGIQAGTDDELREVYGRLQDANRPVLEEGDTTCCYARSEKSWIADPDGVAWEVFLTRRDSAVYGHDAGLTGDQPAADPGTVPAGAACC